MVDESVDDATSQLPLNPFGSPDSGNYRMG